MLNNPKSNPQTLDQSDESLENNSQTLDQSDKSLDQQSDLGDVDLIPNGINEEEHYRDLKCVAGSIEIQFNNEQGIFKEVDENELDVTDLSPNFPLPSFGGQCPPMRNGNLSEACLNSPPPSTCWTSGSQDADCIEKGGLCCNDGCGNYCLDEVLCQKVLVNETQIIDKEVEICSDVPGENIIKEECQDLPQPPKCEIELREKCHRELVPIVKTSPKEICGNQTMEECVDNTIEEKKFPRRNVNLKQFKRKKNVPQKVCKNEYIKKTAE
ncbi:LRP1B [Lepeophtheirus salmonis]|uniref:LRP1B n=1 Tax=Lepeophtheirus salmonis TaxID=72036 RepID=A0A817F9I4_LEPSM|nr:LRP1B [Lepeophtheirus salmonis]CAG9475814.1 LRP1B [Lepeophtheirus salmonis]